MYNPWSVYNPLDHQEHNHSFWAELPLTTCRHFHVQETMTGLCVGDFHISKIIRNGVWCLWGNLVGRKSEERNTADSYPSVKYIFPWNLSPFLSLVELVKSFSDDESSLPMPPFHYFSTHCDGNKRLLQKEKYSQDLALHFSGDVIIFP